MEFELVIPCYNEAASLAAMLSRTVQAAQSTGYDATRFQLIMVENGSADNSREVLKVLQDGPLAAWFHVVQIEKNQGYGYGIHQGLAASHAPYIGWTHADEQCDPKDAFDALRVLRQSAHPERTLVKGRRGKRRLPDFLLSRFMEAAVLLLLGRWISEINAQPKVFARALLDEMRDPPPHFGFDLYALLSARRAGWRIMTIPVTFAPRAHGTSSWAFSLRNRVKTSWRMLAYIWSLGVVSRVIHSRNGG